MLIDCYCISIERQFMMVSLIPTGQWSVEVVWPSKAETSCKLTSWIMFLPVSLHVDVCGVTIRVATYVYFHHLYLCPQVEVTTHKLLVYCVVIHSRRYCVVPLIPQLEWVAVADSCLRGGGKGGRREGATRERMFLTPFSGCDVIPCPLVSNNTTCRRLQYEAKKRWHFRSFPFHCNSVATHFRLPFSCVVRRPFSVPHALLVTPTYNWNVWMLLLRLTNGATYELQRQLPLLNCTRLLPLLRKFQLRSYRLALSLPPTDWALEFNCSARLRWTTVVLLIDWHSSPLLLLDV